MVVKVDLDVVDHQEVDPEVGIGTEGTIPIDVIGAGINRKKEI